MSKAIDRDAPKTRAEALFRQQSLDAGDRKAVETEADKIARLQALRLAKEQSDRIAAEVRKARRQNR